MPSYAPSLTYNVTKFAAVLHPTWLHFCCPVFQCRCLFLSSSADTPVTRPITSIYWAFPPNPMDSLFSTDDSLRRWQPNWPLASDLSVVDLIMVIARLEGADTRPITPVPVPVQPGLKLLHESMVCLYWTTTFSLFLWNLETDIPNYACQWDIMTQYFFKWHHSLSGKPMHSINR